MKYHIVQVVRIVDLNEEVLSEVTFDHGNFETVFLPIGGSVVTYPLGLQGFEVVYDKRKDEVARYKVIDIELNLLRNDAMVQAYLEPITLIIGQHDIGQYNG